MAVINEELAASEISAVVVPTAVKSNVTIEGNDPGVIFLQSLVPNGAWTNITSKKGSYVIDTPNVTISYRFSAGGMTALATRVFFG